MGRSVIYSKICYENCQTSNDSLLSDPFHCSFRTSVEDHLKARLEVNAAFSQPPVHRFRTCQLRQTQWTSFGAMETLPPDQVDSGLQKSSLRISYILTGKAESAGASLTVRTMTASHITFQDCRVRLSTQ
ncbi:hypothetical protein IG631_09594 [Alternaria alternata]|nr:hypothetical protein IG631_09594 [Alternaria alternata]